MDEQQQKQQQKPQYYLIDGGDEARERAGRQLREARESYNGVGEMAVTACQAVCTSPDEVRTLQGTISAFELATRIRFTLASVQQLNAVHARYGLPVPPWVSSADSDVNKKIREKAMLTRRKNAADPVKQAEKQAEKVLKQTQVLHEMQQQLLQQQQVLQQQVKPQQQVMPLIPPPTPKVKPQPKKTVQTKPQELSVERLTQPLQPLPDRTAQLLQMVADGTLKAEEAHAIFSRRQG